MGFFQTRKAGAVVLAAAVLFGVFFGSQRALDAVRSDVWTIFEGEGNGSGHGVKGDLETRRAVGSNLYNLLNDWNYLSPDDPAMATLQDAVGACLVDSTDKAAQEDLVQAIDQVLSLTEGLDGMREEHSKYISNFRAQLKSIENTLSRDPYTAAAKEFNETTLGSFPASVLGPLTGIRELPVYQ